MSQFELRREVRFYKTALARHKQAEANLKKKIPAVAGHPLLQAAAVSAAQQAKFTPTRLSGQPVKVQGVLVYNFAAQ